MIARASLLSITLFLLTSAAAAQSPAKKLAAHTAKPTTIEVPSGTRIPLVLENAISTRTAHAGDPVYFETLYPIIEASRIVIPAGSYMSGQVISAKRPGRFKGRGQLVLKLTQLILPNGYAVSLQGMPSDVGSGGGEEVGKEGKIDGPTSRATDAGIVVRSTVYGAGIGAAAAGATGAKAGLAEGVTAGLLGVLLTRGPEAELPRGTTMNVILDRPISLSAAKVQFKTPGKAPDLAGPPNREPRRRTIPF